MADTEVKRAGQYRYRAEDIRIMAQGATKSVTRDRLLKLALLTDSAARNIEREAHTSTAMKNGSPGLVIRDRLSMEPKKNHPLRLYKKKRKGSFGEPRDLHGKDPFGKRDEQDSPVSYIGWIAGFLVSVQAWARDLCRGRDSDVLYLRKSPD